MAASIKSGTRLLPLTIILLLVGLAVTFTQDRHEDLAFNTLILVFFGVAFAVAVLTSWLKMRSEPGAIVLLLSALSAAGLGAFALFSPSFEMLKFAILTWAAINAALFGYQWVVTKNSKSLTTMLFLGVFVIITALLAGTLPSLMGLLAAFCIIAGVFLGIAAFDPPERQELQHD